uniref:NADH-ubiquinone oxidoreductase chain 3 n=1 Tax=Macropsis notata TaxID=1159701 RepID=A0A4Y1JU30_9HEMI|nr:NADH dehydrogenase subunit 3 [Macropsis notata]AOW43945.1 NADH dehydrogenase subunit 3 [Macropsis notata]
MMNLTLIFLLILMLTTLIIMTIINMISAKSISDKEKLSPFECGFNPMSNKRLPFSIHFFLIAAIFLICDVEIIIMIPMIMTMKTSSVLWWMTTSVSFIMVLILGLYHEWSNGMLNWTN